ncbi:bifunctional demethylmenaquinone methyltransferase/2-methoxy-6-polyprenyl-1,4-benzoquinol methylase UbiE [Desulfosarcina sp. OttesenSCG-928-G17]|nr:bifunctional demethylmenaquinone methyltransferase/2-methoxy-6-polyprenyl-1,4-benzoquinol methylase UbiE [Desulfosarcina sp. OttesenSCG-928-G17]
MGNRELPFIRGMFDRIAPHYDLLNRLLSLRQDVLWRKKMVAAITAPEGGCVLDVACGTGDVALEILRQKGAGTRVVGVDFSPGMITLAKKKIRDANASIHLVVADALALPVMPESFHAVTIAFGIRNIQDKERALKGFYNCLVPGGKLLVLELSTPPANGMRETYMTYFQKVLPKVGRLFSKHAYAYSYLPESVTLFPPADLFMTMMKDAGFSNVSGKRLTFGIATLFTGVRM